MLQFKTKIDFIPNTQSENAQVFSDHLPGGQVFTAKNIQGSNLYKTLYGLSAEVTRSQSKINQLSNQYNIFISDDLLDEWEQALGIPDECFTTNGIDNSQRRLQIIAKLAKMNIQTPRDFVELASLFGYNISILYGADFGNFPAEFPILLGTDDDVVFSMIIKFDDIDKPTNLFPAMFPILFTSFDVSEMLKCLFNHQVQANVKIIYFYRNYP
jgi:hypothetical protein